MAATTVAQTPSGHAHGPGGLPDQSRADRRASFSLVDFPVPGGREEDWRFTPLDRLLDLHSCAEAAGPPVEVDVDAPAPVRVETVGRDDARLGRTGAPEDRVAAAAWNGFGRSLVVSLPAGERLDAPVHVRVTGAGGLEWGHALVVAEPGSAGAVVVDFTGGGVFADNLEIDVADGAALTFVSIQDWDSDAVHLSAHHVRLGRDATLRHVIVTLGGDVVRITPSVRFTGPGAQVDLLGLYFADAGQHLEHRLFVDHAQPHCRSNVVYKGALQGDGARADSVPNLEIETGEIVGAGHASATGRFDDEQLFYLQARGISEDEARRLVVRGFFGELIGQIGVPDVEARLTTAIDAELARTMGTGAALPPDEADAADEEVVA